MSKSKIGYIVIIALLVATSILSINLFFRQRSDHDVLDIHVFPHEVGEWSGKDLGITEKEYKILETQNLISREYTKLSRENIYLFIVYSETNRSVFHPPEVCLIGSGIKIEDIVDEKIALGEKEVPINKLYLEKDGTKYMALYCYKAGNFYTNSYYLQQAYFALNQLIGKRRGGATVRVAMLTSKNEHETLETLKKFITQTIQTLEQLT